MKDTVVIGAMSSPRKPLFFYARELMLFSLFLLVCGIALSVGNEDMQYPCNETSSTIASLSLVPNNMSVYHFQNDLYLFRCMALWTPGQGNRTMEQCKRQLDFWVIHGQVQEILYSCFIHSHNSTLLEKKDL